MRKSEIVTVPKWSNNRDLGKQYLITEMPSGQSEKWALKAFLMLKGSGERIPDDVVGLGMVGVAILGINVFLRGNLRTEDLEPLLDEMFTCVKIVRDQRHPDVATDLVSDDDIEEVQTRLWLRSEVLRVHTGFSPAEALWKLISAIRTSPAAI